MHIVMPIDNVYYDSIETLVDCVVHQWNTQWNAQRGKDGGIFFIENT